eukprot:1714239-Prymnesium_polylepis.1
MDSAPSGQAEQYPLALTSAVRCGVCEKILLDGERLGIRTEDLCISSRPPYPLGHCSVDLLPLRLREEKALQAAQPHTALER